MSDRRISLSIPILWEYVREVRRMVRDALAGRDEGLRSAATMVASELVENAIKYGESVHGAPDVTFSLTVGTDCLTIEVTNGVASTTALDDVREALDQIGQAGDREALYVSRLERLLARPSQQGKLGLYRVGFEGGFDLRYTYVQSVLTVTATRGIA